MGGGGGLGGPPSYVLLLPPCLHTCHAGNKHGPSFPSCQHGLLMSLKEGMSAIHLGQCALKDRADTLTQPTTYSCIFQSQCPYCVFFFVNLRISQTWYGMSIIPVFGRWIGG